MTNQEMSGIQVVCAGLGRTGTMSLTDALKILGYNPYHYIDFNHASTWTDLADGKCSANDVIDLIVRDGYDAVLENPTCEIYRDIIERFPKAKVILTVRDNPEKFESSWMTLMNTAVITEQPFSFKFPSFFGWIPIFRQLKKIRHFMGTTHLHLEPGSLTHGWRSQPSGWLANQYERHNQDVIKNIPSEKLLIFNVKEGWKPLCEFLECEAPDQDFPHSKVNDTRSLEKMKKMFLIATYGWIPTIAASTVAGAFALARFINSRQWVINGRQ